MKIYVMRHSETRLNAEKRMQGILDIPLNERGIFLAEETGKGLTDVKFDVIYSSPLSRTIETAKLATRNQAVPMVLDSRIREMDWGEWEGTAADGSEIEELKEQLEFFFNDPAKFKKAPGGEEYPDVVKRVNEFMDELVSNPDNKDKNILISTHGIPSRCMLMYADPVDMKDFWRGRVTPNCGVSILSINENEKKIIEQDHIYYDEKYLTDYYSLDK